MIKFQQLINTAAADLGLGETQKIKLETHLATAFTLGMQHAEKIMEEAFEGRFKPTDKDSR